jgi:uncharacterized membrane protein
LLVTATGVLEFIGAIGMLLPQALAAAAYGLIALLVAMFPANVYAARAELVVAGRRASPLVWRFTVATVLDFGPLVGRRGRCPLG